MKFNLYVIFDKVAQEAGVPFDAKNDEIAIRKFEEVVNKQIRPIKTVSVSDYELRLVGSFDSETSLLSEYPDKEAGYMIVCNGSDVNEWVDEKSNFPQIAYEKIAEAIRKNPDLLKNPDVGSPVINAKKKHFWSK